MPVFAIWPVSVRVMISFTTGAVRSAILATAGLLVLLNMSAKFEFGVFYLATLC